MADLSRNQNRTPMADRPTTRRDSIISSRRLNDQVDRRGSADIRSGTRGDVGGADALLDFARRVNGAAGAVVERQNSLDTKQMQEDAAAGAVDFQSGNVDPEKVRQSLAYSSSVSMSRTRRDWTKVQEQLDDDIKAARGSEEYLDADTPAKRQAIIDEVIEARVSAFALDPEDPTKARAFGSPQAAFWAADQIEATRATIQSKINGEIEQEFIAEAISDESETLRATLRRNETVDFEASFKAFPSYVPPAQRKAAMLAVFDDVVGELEAGALELLETDPQAALEMQNRARSIRRSLVASKQNPDPAPVVGEAAAPASAGAKPEEAPKAPYVPKGPAGTITTGLRSSGMSDAVIAGFLGNFEHESALGKNKNSGDGGTAHGLAQWRFERVDNFKQVIGKHPRNATLEEQVRFVAWEMKNPAKAGMTVEQRDQILAAKTPEQAAELIDRFYERSNGKSRSARASAARRFASEGLEGGTATLDAIDPSVINPASATSLMDRMSNSSNLTGPSTGAYSLNPEERMKYSSAMRVSDQRFNTAYENARKEKQTETALGYAARLAGIGTPATVTEIRTAMQRGEISIDNGQSLLNMVEADLNRDEADVRRTEADNEQAVNEDRRNRAETSINSIVAPVVSGRLRPSEANKKILDMAAAEPDPLVRAEILQAASQVNAVAKLTAENPAVRKGGSTISGWADQYARDMKSQLPPSLHKQADAWLKNQIATRVTLLAEGEVSPAAVDEYLKRSEDWLDRTVETYIKNEKNRIKRQTAGR